MEGIQQGGVIMAAQDFNTFNTWKDQWYSLKTSITELEGHYGSWPDFPRKKTILSLLKSLSAFGEDHFKFFYERFSNEALELSPDFPPEFVLSTIIDQVSNDLSVIQQAAERRIVGSPNMIETLAIADKLAYTALQPAIQQGLLQPDTTVLTYFQKSPSIRVIPYANVALIGIPLTCINNPKDFLAIPHEIGHYVFWKGRNKQGERLEAVVKNFADQNIPNPYRRWSEETFADIYGCLVAGPVMALDFQDLSLTFSDKKFSEDDADHPTPILRPSIYAKVLFAKGLEQRNGWAELADSLNDHWIAQREKRTNNPQIIHSKELSESEVATYSITKSQPNEKIIKIERVPVDQAISLGVDLQPKSAEPIDKLIKGILEQLADIQSDWSGDLSGLEKESDVPKLYQRFKDNFPALCASIKVLPPDLNPTANFADVWVEWVKAEGFFGGNPPPPLSETIKFDKWLPVFQASGWTTEGEIDLHGG
jgi:hypothetical protein